MSSSALVLAIDDDADVRDILAVELGRAGVRTITAPDGATGLALFASERPSVVLLDVLMPGLGGFEVLRKMRALPHGRDTPVVVLTALTDTQTHARALAEGADDFLTKPVRVAELQARVNVAISLAEARHGVASCHGIMRDQRIELEAGRARRQMLVQLVVRDMKDQLGVVRDGAAGGLAELAPGSAARAGMVAALEAVESLGRMAGNVLDVEAPLDPAMHMQLQATDLVPMLRSVCDGMGHFGAARAVRCRLDAPAALVIDCDRDLVRRVAANLVDNAIAYSAEGGAVRVALEAEGDRALLRVDDAGPGVPEHARTSIFERRALVVGAGGSGGAPRGLGLPFCRIATELHGGRIWVEDSPDGGASFRVELPVHGGAEAENAGASAR